jgi:hypothetical protein
VSCPELDFLVETALEVPEVYGSKMTGRNCTITLVARSSAKTLIMHLRSKYKERFNRDCICVECLPSEGCGGSEDLAMHQPTQVPSSFENNTAIKRSDVDDDPTYRLIPAAIALGVVVAAAPYLYSLFF